MIMVRRLLAPILALAAICPLAPIAPAAGSTSLFEAEGGPVVLTGSQAETHVFEITGPGVDVECAEADFAGTAEDGAGQVTLSSTYSGTIEEPASEHCSSSIGAADIEMNGCAYILTGETTGEDEGTDAALWVECPEEDEITITTELATLHIHEQTPTEGGVTYANLPEGELEVRATATGITYACTPHFLCTLGGIPTEGNNAIYTGTTVVAGYEYEGGPANDDEFIEGKQVDVGWVEGESGDVLSAPAVGEVDLVGEDTGTEKVSLNAGTVECSEAGYQGGADVFPASEITLSIGLAGCEAFGFANTEVQTNECTYVFHEGEEVEGEEFEGTADIECPEGEAIEIVARVRGLLKCRATIGSQSGLSGVTYGSSGTGSERDLEITLGLNEVAYTQHTGEGLGKCESGSFEDGEISGEPTVIGENDENEQVGVWVQPTGPPVLRSEIEDTTLIGEDTGVEKIELEAGVAECAEAGYKGTISAIEVEAWSLAPEFANCEAFGFSTAEVKWNGCEYGFSGSEAEAEEGFEGKVEIDCPEGKTIEAVAESGETLKCRATIGSQAGLSPLTYTNSGSGSSRHYKSTLSLSGVKYAQEAGEGTGKCESGEFENGKIVGAPTVIGENAEKEQVGIWIR